MKLQLLVVVTLGLSALAYNDNSMPAMIQFDGPEGEKATETAFEDALQEEKPALEASPRLAATDLHEAAPIPQAAEGANDKMSEFEKDVTDLVLGLGAGGFAATPMGGSVKKIKDVIEKEMLPAVKAAHAANQNELNELAGRPSRPMEGLGLPGKYRKDGRAIKMGTGCYRTRDMSLGKSDKHRLAYIKTSPKHKTCRTGEAGLYVENLEQHEEWKEKKQIKQLKCKAYSEASKKTGDQNANKNIVSKGGSEAVETYVRRISATVCGKPNSKGNGGHGDGGLLDQLLDAKHACEKATRIFNAQTVKCKRLDRQWHAKVKQCNSLQDTMDAGACTYAIEKKDACEAYAECWAAKNEAYGEAEKTVRKEEIDRKAEWRGLKRMHCLIHAFTDMKVTDKEVDACKKRSHSTKHLDIVYPKIPSKVDVCQVPNRYPTTSAYKAAEFTPLPMFAKGKVDANECTGVAEISEVPNTGSPKSCKCDRITMNGPYSPGPVVVCKNCNDIRRSKDKSSCPIGTKLFAPQSRQDWDSFLKSAQPLRAPNWVIDVTRPQNGCGGCTRYTMNSKTSQQKSWVTQDESPWWLRSTRYNEPNGDYHANCYLDLWHNPKDANKVTWNDGSCSYHAKSYYCQAAQVGTNPKSGSPNGCKCKKVELNGDYSASMLVKCTGCLDIRRANDKNSCPSGMKIFSPATRSDWKTFIRSAVPLRNPHWIIDVTRPQNGCGGCTRHPMTSKIAAQATWRTADRSPWWLRSTRYSEPNGDYRANCYLDLWKTPPNENSVTWNDGNCNYHSKSYYCQSAKSAKKAKATVTAPPWKASQVSTKPAKGSPKGCKCEKLKLKGEYKAGAILRCTGCLDARKKGDKNSCPHNTKLFSPQSRGDWKTFLASGGKPLRAPHWIVDVTRPQNGCGGCTGNAMNSANTKQSSWKTSDGAPWWLRSRTYNEPNGDYTANCYLDLWKTPKDENAVTWNDGRCNYHSKSYYCQPKNQ